MTKTLKQVIIQIATICKHNPGTGYFGAVLTYKNIIKKISGTKPKTSLKRIEITAVIETLQKLKEPCEVTIYSPSTYVCYAVNNGWLNNWEKNNWTRSRHRELANKDLWQKLNELLTIHKVAFVCTQKQDKKSKSYRLAVSLQMYGL